MKSPNKPSLQECNPKTALCIVGDSPPEGGEVDLYQTRSGKFFLVLTDWNSSGVSEKIIPLSKRRAMEWCIKTLIPECFRGYVLESI